MKEEMNYHVLIKRKVNLKITLWWIGVVVGQEAWVVMYLLCNGRETKLLHIQYKRSRGSTPLLSTLFGRQGSNAYPKLLC